MEIYKGKETRDNRINKSEKKKKRYLSPKRRHCDDTMYYEVR